MVSIYYCLSWKLETYQSRANRRSREESDENTCQNNHITNIGSGSDHDGSSIAAREAVVMQDENDDGQSLRKYKKKGVIITLRFPLRWIFVAPQLINSSWILANVMYAILRSLRFFIPLRLHFNGIKTRLMLHIIVYV